MHVFIRGKRSVLEAATAGIPMEKLIFAENYREKDEILRQLRAIGGPARSVPVETVPRETIEKITGEEKRTGVAARVRLPETRDVREVLGVVEKSGRVPFLVVLDHLEDPQNVGAIIRSAEAAGVDAVLLPKWRSAGLTASVVQASAGALFHLPLIEVSSVPQSIDALKKYGIWIVGADGNAEREYHTVDLKIPLALVVGSEGQGMKRLVREKCDFLARIPMLGKIRSLNASASAAVLFYEVVRQRAGGRDAAR